MPRSLAALRIDADSRRKRILAAIPPEFPFALTWDSFTGGAEAFHIKLNKPSTKPTPGGVPLVDASEFEPIIFYEVQLASNGTFTADLTTHSLGTSRIANIRIQNVTRFARARARLVNTDWGEWVPASGSAGSGTLFDKGVDDLDDISDGTTHGKVNLDTLTTGRPDLAKSIQNKNLDNIADTTAWKKTTPDEKTGSSRAFTNINADNRYETKALSESAPGDFSLTGVGGFTTSTTFVQQGGDITDVRVRKSTTVRARMSVRTGDAEARIRVSGGALGNTTTAVGQFSKITGLTQDSTVTLQVEVRSPGGGGGNGQFEFQRDTPMGDTHFQP